MAVYMFVVVALYPAFKNDVSLNQFTEGKSMVAALYVAFRNLSPPPAFTASLALTAVPRLGTHW
jgi:hypothetical protein